MTTIILTSRPWWYRKPRRTEVGYGRISEQGAQANIVSPTDTQLSWAITPIRDTGLLFRAAWVVKHWRISRILSAPTGSVAVELWRGNGSNNPLSVGDANAKIADIGTCRGGRKQRWLGSCRRRRQSSRRDSPTRLRRIRWHERSRLLESVPRLRPVMDRRNDGLWRGNEPDFLFAGSRGRSGAFIRDVALDRANLVAATAQTSVGVEMRLTSNAV